MGAQEREQLWLRFMHGPAQAAADSASLLEALETAAATLQNIFESDLLRKSQPCRACQKREHTPEDKSAQSKRKAVESSSEEMINKMQDEDRKDFYNANTEPGRDGDHSFILKEQSLAPNSECPTVSIMYTFLPLKIAHNNVSWCQPFE